MTTNPLKRAKAKLSHETLKKFVVNLADFSTQPRLIQFEFSFFHPILVNITDCLEKIEKDMHKKNLNGKPRRISKETTYNQ